MSSFGSKVKTLKKITKGVRDAVAFGGKIAPVVTAVGAYTAQPQIVALGAGLGTAAKINDAIPGN
eukprot:2951591-Amphidinium_carterae.1